MSNTIVGNSREAALMGQYMLNDHVFEHVRNPSASVFLVSSSILYRFPEERPKKGPGQPTLFEISLSLFLFSPPFSLRLLFSLFFFLVGHVQKTRLLNSQYLLLIQYRSLFDLSKLFLLFILIS